MSTILQLPSHIADLIAAGEVVERPASVVKELAENAIDAGAKAVTVEIQRGGMAYIRVTDNGAGIAPEDVPTAFLRHATSKLRRAEDLGAIGTLGFRGEALAAISAVSRMEVMTRRAADTAGTALSLEGGLPGGAEAVGCPAGTTMIVRDLFYNTPARLKFMKKDSAESAAVGGLMQHMALSRPDIAFRFLRDGQEQMNTPGSGDLHAAVYAALGRDFALALTQVEGASEGLKLSGYVTEPVAGRGTRGMQIFFVNGRLIKSPLLTAALEEAYRNQLLKGRFPGCVLHLAVPVDQVDVNVHPAKTVVKFLNERPIFSLVHHTVEDALSALRPGQSPAPKAAPTARSVPQKGFYQTMTAEQYRAGCAQKDRGYSLQVSPDTAELPDRRGTARDSARIIDPKPPRQVPPMRSWEALMPKVQGPAVKDAPPAVPPQERPSEVLPKVPDLPSEVPPKVLPQDLPSEAPPEAAPPVREPEQLAMLAEPPRPWRLVGEVLRTYIIAEDGEDVWLIDKHAAHERINFDRLKADPEPPMRQALLAPAAIDLPPEDAAALLAELPLLAEFGFAAEDFGDGTLLVREVPSDIGEGQLRETLEMLAERLRTGGTADPAAARDAMLHTMACKSAIKGGWHSDERELLVLLEKVRLGEVRCCPHGRPVAVRLTKYELEKMFKRA